MRKSMIFCVLMSLVLLAGCREDRSKSETADRNFVDKQQQHYQIVQPLEFYDWSIPRDVYQQIYRAITTQKVTTFTVVETMTGELKYAGTSIGYPIPADMSLTNPLQAYEGRWENAVVSIEQAEPMGLFSSKNTDGTWVLYVDEEKGVLWPFYTEQKCSAFPFIMEQDEKGVWRRADREPPKFTIEVRTEPRK